VEDFFDDNLDNNDFEEDGGLDFNHQLLKLQFLFVSNPMHL